MKKEDIKTFCEEWKDFYEVQGTVKIISIKKRNWFERLFTINTWNVELEHNGKYVKMAVWGGSGSLSMKYLLRDVFEKLGDKEIKIKQLIDLEV